MSVTNNNWASKTDSIVGSEAISHLLSYLCVFGGAVVLLGIFNVETKLSLLIMLALGFLVLVYKMVELGVGRNVHLAEIRDNITILNATQGFPDSQVVIGSMYCFGQGRLNQNFVNAHMWLNIALSKLPAGVDRRSATDCLDQAKAEMTPDQIEEAQKLTREWMEKHGK